MRYVLSIFFLLCLPATAAVYYVDFVGGTNAASGMSTNFAWKHCPGDSNASGNPAATSLNPGDTVRFKRGVAYLGTIRMLWSGTAGSRITYDGETLAWGTGTRAEIDGQSSRTSGFTDVSTAKNGITIRGFYMHHFGGYAEADPIWSTSTWITGGANGTGIDLDNGGADIDIYNCWIEKCGIWQNDNQIWDGDVIQGVGVALKNNRRVLLTNVVAGNLRIPFGVKSSSLISDITFRNCYASNQFVWGWDMAPNGHGCVISNITLLNSYSLNYAQFDTGNWQGNPTNDNPHTNGAFIRCPFYNNVAYYNIVIDGHTFYSDVIGASNGGTGSIYVSEGAGVTIRNCRFLSDAKGYGPIRISYAKRTITPQHIGIYNNSFYTSYRPISFGSGFSGDSVKIFNNICYRTTTSLSTTALMFENAGYAGTLQCNYNIYFSNYSPINNWNMSLAGGAYRSFASWKGLGWDPQSKLLNPLFVDTTGLPSTLDLRLLTNSPAIGAGTNLSALFSTDADGNARPASGSWDMGAYIFESGEEPADTNAPSPNPMVLISAVATGPYTATVTATNATHPSGGLIVYEFENITYGSIVTQTNPVRMSVGLSPSTTYTYRVRARGPNGILTDWSNTLDATTGSLNPSIVTAVSATVNNLIIQ